MCLRICVYAVYMQMWQNKIQNVAYKVVQVCTEFTEQVFVRSEYRENGNWIVNYRNKTQNSIKLKKTTRLEFHQIKENYMFKIQYCLLSMWITIDIKTVRPVSLHITDCYRFTRGWQQLITERK